MKGPVICPLIMFSSKHNIYAKCQKVFCSKEFDSWKKLKLIDVFFLLNSLLMV